MGTPQIQFTSFIPESSSPEDLEQLGQKAVAWLEKEKSAGLLPYIHEPSLKNLLDGILPPPAQMAKTVNANGEIVMVLAPESEENSLPNARTVLSTGTRILFFGYAPTTEDTPTVEELRSRSMDALGVSVSGGVADIDESNLGHEEF
jgi:hypothetical protein